MQRSFGLLLSFILAFCFSCAPKYTRLGNPLSPQLETPDYADYNSWAAHPYKYDVSDSIPAPIRDHYQSDSTIDVFFLHPTTYTQRHAIPWNANPRDPNLNNKTDYSTILYQASVFNQYRVFAPRYRQAHLRSYYSDSEEASNAFDTAYQDIKNAFLYYLEHYNNNRPIVIASHSQGTSHGMRLLKEFFENKKLSQKLVVAYLVGMYIPDTYFTGLRICRDSVDTGCICAWRSFQNGYLPAFVQKENGSGVVVNPLTWTTNDTYATAEMNRGAILRNFNKVYPGLADAKIQSGVIWIHKPRFPGSIFLRLRNYHVADINFFYINIRENLRTRINANRGANFR